MIKLDLTSKELLVYAVIYSFSQDLVGEFFGSLNYLSKRINSNPATVCRILKNLVEKNLLRKRNVYENGVKYCKYQALKPLTKSQEGIDQKSTNNKSYNKEYSKEREGKENESTPSPLLFEKQYTNVKEFDESIIDTVNRLIVSTSTLLKQHFSQGKIDDLHLAFKLKNHDVGACFLAAVELAKKENNASFRKDTFFKNLKIFLVDGIPSNSKMSLQDTKHTDVSEPVKDLEALQNNLNALEEY